jgi:hypothetical protein
VRAIPEGDASLGKKVGNRHHGRADDAEGMLNAVHLEDFDKRFLSCHFHDGNPFCC